MTGNVAALLGVNLLFLAAGAGVTRALGAWRSVGGVCRSAAVVYLCGLAGTGVALQLLLVLGVPFTRWTVLATAASLASAGLLAAPLVRAARDPAPSRLLPPATMVPAALVVVAMVVLLAASAWFQPLGKWDAWAQWTARARVIVTFDGMAPELLSGAAYRTMNPDYPALLPAVEAANFVFMGEVDTRAIHLQFWLVYAAFLLAMLQLLLPRAPATYVWPVVALTSVAPAFQVLSLSALADVPVAVLFALAGFHAWSWLVERDGAALRLFALLSAGALATKFEGRILVGALALTLAMLVALRERDRLRPTVLWSAAALVGVVPWSLWSRTHDVRGVIVTTPSEALTGDLVSKLDRIPPSAWALVESAVRPGAWIVLAPLAAAGVALAFRYGEDRLTPLLVTCTALVAGAGLVLAYWASPLELRSHLDRSTFRVVTGPMLFVALLLPLLVASAAGRRAAEGQPERRA